MKPEHRQKLQQAGALMRRILDRCFVFTQMLLPTHFLSWLMFRIARIENERFKNYFISTFVRLYKVNLGDAALERIASYAHFNAFFTRALKPRARPVDPDPRTLISPVDGTISQLGDIHDQALIQAKGMDYSVTDLMGGTPSAALFRNGRFCTIYLAPHNYHRIHMPANGRLTEWSYVPGRLFSVNGLSARKIPNLFVRNERICAVFETDFGPLAVIMVGALFVGSIETTWAGLVTPPHGQKAGTYSPMSPVTLMRGQELGRFNMGSTVILLAPRGMLDWRQQLQPGKPVRVGLSLGTLTPSRRN
jgi:phosphatidylserine decarboxylase